ncbi:PREDICTED: protein PXR1-like [Trachymyrmex cornetzi]|uniref:protein PXR1-like n=1 Tax=Trachymyrmex cornetzi TaxID=471704 RepID=UPI00084EE94D|nr:PREDICTED: protein PXR1-like [Trachymyrmex cornetzi]
MNERAESEREKAETLGEPVEAGGDKVQEWLSGKWGEGSVVKGRGEKKGEDKSGAEKGRRGRPTKAVSLGRERRDSSASIVSHLSKCNRGSDSDSDQEEKEKKKQRVKIEKVNVDFKEERKEKTEGRMEKMVEIMRRLLDETKREIMEKIEQTGEEIRRGKKEMKEEIEKI